MAVDNLPMLFSETEGGIFGSPGQGIGLSPRAEVEQSLSSLPTMSKVGLALQSFGHGVLGLPDPIQGFVDERRRDRLLKIQEFKIHLSALEDGLKMSEMLSGPERENFVKAYGQRLDQISPGLSETFGALSRRPDITKLLGKHADIPMARMSLALDPSGRSFLKMLNTTEGMALAERQLDEKAIGLITQKVTTLVRNWQELVPKEMAEKFTKDGVLSASEIAAANAFIRNHPEQKYRQVALDETEMQVLNRNQDAVYMPLGILTGKREQDVLTEKAKEKAHRVVTEIGVGNGLRQKAYVQDGKVVELVGSPYEKKEGVTVKLPDFNVELKLADDYRQDTKGFKDAKAKFEASTQYYAAISTQGKKPTSAGDRAMIFTYMKMLDPGDEVAVKDMQDIDRLAGVPDRIIQGVKNFIAGKLLTDDVRKEMFAIIRSEFTQHNRAQRQIEKEYEERARRYKLNPQNVVIPYSLEIE